MQRNKQKIIFFLVILITILTFTSFSHVFAAPFELVPTSCTGDNKAGGCDVCDGITTAMNITKIMLGMLGTAALGMFIFGGINMLMSFGKSEFVQKGKDTLISAFKGVIIIMGSWVIINYGLAVLLNQDMSNVKLFANDASGHAWYKQACGGSPVACTEIGKQGNCGVDGICNGNNICQKTCTAQFGGTYTCKNETTGSNCQTNWCPGELNNIKCCQ